MKSPRVVEKVSAATEMKNPARPEARMRRREAIEHGAALKKHDCREGSVRGSQC